MAVGSQQRAAQKFIVFEQFEKLNTQSVRQALKESELAWLENLQPIAPNNLAAVPGPLAASIATLLATASSFWYADIGGVDYIFSFGADGSASSVNIATGAINQFAPAGTFSTAPDLTTWQASRVLINDSLCGYCTFDGNVFTRQGGVSPVITVTNGGVGYSTPPPVTISGGSGSGATAVSVVSGGSVIAVNLTNPGSGYKATDTLTVAFGTSVGSGGAGHVTMTGFNVASIIATNPGNFAPNPPPTGSPENYSLTITGGGGINAAAFATLVVGALGGYSVQSITITNPGTGYTSPPSVSLSFSGGTGPVFAAQLGVENVATIVKDASGTGYLAPPIVTISGGLGPGGVAATAHATLTGTAINTLVLDTPGSGYISTPTVIIGAGSGAAATAHVWPFVPKGTTLAVFQGRVWLGGGQLLQYTGTGGFDDFNSADASGSLTISDADLVHAITALRSANNYLYIMGDQSVKQIGNISLNANGNVTLFTILTLSSDQGTIYPRSCASYNRVFLFANSNGIYGVFGSSVQKISDDLDGIFKLINFSKGLQAAILDLNNIHNVVYLVNYVDPIAGARSLLLIFNGKKWWLASQGNGLITMATASSLSTGKTQLYGSSGTDVTALFGDATVPVAFKLQSSLTHHGNAVQRKRTIRAGFAVTMGAQGSLTMTVDTDEASNPYVKTVKAGFNALSFNAEGSGRYLGMTLTGTLTNFVASNATIEYQEIDLGNKANS